MSGITAVRTEEAFERNRKSLLDEYKRTGRIGRITPKDIGHARMLADVLAKKIRKENRHG